MINRIIVIVLCGFLLGSLSYNAIQWEELVENRRQAELDSYHYEKVMTWAHEKESN